MWSRNKIFYLFVRKNILICMVKEHSRNLRDEFIEYWVSLLITGWEVTILQTLNRKGAKGRGMLSWIWKVSFQGRKKISFHTQFTLPVCHPEVCMLKIHIYYLISSRTTNKSRLRPFVLPPFILPFHAI